MFEIELIKQQIIKGLDTNYREVTLRDLPHVTVSIEADLVSYIHDYTIAYVTENIPKIKPLANDRLMFGATEIFVRIGTADIRSPHVLAIVFLPVNPSASLKTLTKRTFPIKGIGQYQTVEVYTPSRMQKYHEMLGDLACSILVTGYEWLRQCIILASRKRGNNVSTSLYSYLREIFASDPDIPKYLWLALIDKGQSFYAFDEEKVRDALQLLLREVKHPIAVPSLDITTLLTTIIPFKDAHSRIVLSENKCIPIDLKTSKYLSTEPYFELSEERMEGTDLISAYPIEREGQRFLVAFFPTKLKDRTLPTLEKNSEFLRNIFRNQQKDIRSTLSSIQHISRNPEIIRLAGEFFGGILGIPSTKNHGNIYERADSDDTIPVGLTTN